MPRIAAVVVVGMAPLISFWETVFATVIAALIVAAILAVIPWTRDRALRLAGPPLRAAASAVPFRIVRVTTLTRLRATAARADNVSETKLLTSNERTQQGQLIAVPPPPMPLDLRARALKLAGEIEADIAERDRLPLRNRQMVGDSYRGYLSQLQAIAHEIRASGYKAPLEFLDLVVDLGRSEALEVIATIHAIPWDTQSKQTDLFDPDAATTFRYYVGGAAGERCEGVPARDLTRAEYDGLTAQERACVDNNPRIYRQG